MTKAERDLLMAVAAALGCMGRALSQEERSEMCTLADVYLGQDWGPDILRMMRAVAAEAAR